MRLKRLELQGFKSFLDRTVLDFERGVTGVVGPNGCGKSNIVDAILWVMGEQSPKHLRGESMTDIIFNGSDTRAPTSMAEVSLILDREGVPLAPQFSSFDRGEEISITRRIYRDGTGEFLINRSTCRLKDIHELFMDTGVGRRTYSIIEQGQIDRMINVKPDDRRGIFEEVAGVTKYKAKRKEAERKLELTRQNLLRLQDILNELEKQIRSLKIQASKARKYRELKGELEVTDLYLLGRTLERQAALSQQFEEERQRLISQRSQSEAICAQMDAELTQLEIARLDQEKLIETLSLQERSKELEQKRLENELALLEERKRYLGESSENLEQELEELDLRQERIQLETTSRRDEIESLELGITGRKAQLAELEGELRAAQARREELLRAKQSVQNRTNDLLSQRNRAQSQVEFAVAKETELLERQAEINQKLSELVCQVDLLKTQLTTAEESLNRSLSDSKQAEQEVATANSECQTLSAELSEIEEQLFAKREQYHTQVSRLQSLEELQTNLEGYSSSAREIISQLGSQQAAIPLAEVLQPDSELEEMLELLLGNEMNALVFPTADESWAVASIVIERGLERVKLYALDQVRETHDQGTSTGTKLLERIRVAPLYQSLVNALLGDFYVVANQEEARKAAFQHPTRSFVVLSEKLVLHGNTSLSAGNAPSRTGIFSRRREIEELRVECENLSAEIEHTEVSRKTHLESLNSRENLAVELWEKLSRLHVQSVEHRKEKERIQLELARVDREYLASVSDSERNVQRLDSTRDEKDRAANEQAQCDRDLEALATSATTADSDIADAVAQLELTQNRISEARVEQSRESERLSAAQYQVQRLESEYEESYQRITSLKHQQEREATEIDSLDEARSRIESQQQEQSDLRNALLAQMSDVKAAHGETYTRLGDLRNEKDTLQKRRDQIAEESTQIELKLASSTTAVCRVKEVAEERYQATVSPLSPEAALDLEKTPLLAEQLEIPWANLFAEERETLLEEHIKNLREKVDRYGEVNLTAIHEFDECQKRYDFLTEQKTDLEKAIQTLEEAILKIDVSTKERFEETFEAVNRKFKEIFPILFNGGKAELMLVHGENSVDAGVDIMVQPPGKRLQSITLLSGGEKALTAVSLVLSIFARRPSPFCLLDEVDAPLDDANVSRFNTVIRKMAEKTQFIVITHNKKTMEIAEALYGVTMERAGISKMTSVRLN